MLLMVEKGIRDGMCQVTHRYAKANTKYMKNYDKNIESSYLVYLDANNLYGWTMSQKLPINSFKQVKELSKFNESLIKNYDENSDKGMFLKQMLSIQKIYLYFIEIYHFYLTERRQENVISLFVPYKTKKTMLIT